MLPSTIQDIYSLSPMQEGMLFHSLYDTESGVYLNQVRLTLSGEIDKALFRRAWELVVDRHTALRTSFHWEELKTPVQVVHTEVDLSWAEQDWRDLLPDQREDRLAAWLQEGRRRPLDLSKAPLMRFALVRMSDDVWIFVWIHHHLLLDGWSLPLVLRDLFSIYRTSRLGMPCRLDPAPPYSAFIDWLEEQKGADRELFWSQTLRGFTGPTPIAVDRLHTRPDEGSTPFGEERLVLPRELLAELQSLAVQGRVTLNTLLQGVWALLLSRYSGEEDVVFGATVSGRPADLPRVESIVGLFLNTLPMRVEADPDRPALFWLQEIQSIAVELREHEHTPLAQIQAWSEVPKGVPLFDSILVFENFPVDGSELDPGPSARVREMKITQSTNYPLTLMVSAGLQLYMQILYDRFRFDAATVCRILAHVRLILEGFAREPLRRLGEAVLLSEPERLELLSWNATQRSYELGSCLHELVEAQAERSPQAGAVVFEG
ncbi:MAG TPA: condensation domain-containing protein, partial [Thermoanaerobaculia bacterium]|nr:condensation domain-containing protein [Thermoanaerobaculia bacterium]